jgi:hypothetical protein
VRLGVVGMQGIQWKYYQCPGLLNDPYYQNLIF